ncbi:MAG TPA: radical SAM family heme chaperone HemW, partial [Steroidobacteraceae bacterium]|nr:radical SAM family heme chaperone HemW [Steroidobacteraceae bacterium]
DFNSYTLQGELPRAAYLARLERDLAEQAGAVRGREIVSVFLGGGTPSLFPPQAIERVLAAARAHLGFAPAAEVTLEANPGTIERGRFAEYRAAGVTRVSLGAQTFDAATLAALGRIHSPAETRRAAEELHAAGLANFNLDLMYALPGQDPAGALQDIDEALALVPAHLSHYQLTLEPGTVFAARPPPLPDDDAAAAMLGACAARLEEAGFAQYEVSAWARPGAQCRHNLNYWNFGDYLGVGAGAHGKLTQAAAIVRTTHLREPRRYLAAQAPESRPVPESERAFEFMLNALRLTAGFEARLFTERTGLTWESIRAPLAAAAARGLLIGTPSGYRPSSLGLRFLNDLLLEFLPEMPEKSYVSALSTPTASGAAGYGSGRYSQALNGSSKNERITRETG